MRLGNLKKRPQWAWLTVLAVLGLALFLGQPVSHGSQVVPGASGSVVDEDVIRYINTTLEKAWQDNGIEPSRPASEYEWLRRVYLDVVGRIPTVAEIEAYLKMPAATRRKQVVQALLRSDDYADSWASIWTIWLITRTSPPGVSRTKLHEWLAESLAVNKPYNVLARELITARGKCEENGPANFIAAWVGEPVPGEFRQRDGYFDMVPLTSRITKVFLGMQIHCTQCHNHPFIDSRKHDQFWKFNVFLRQVRREPAVIQGNNNKTVARFYAIEEDPNVNPSGAVFYEQRNGLVLSVSASYLNGTRPPRLEPGKRRDVLADLIIQDPMFAKALVNRYWAHFFGRGFCHPFDDFGEHNEVAHAELLDKLADAFVAANYDLRRLITWITLSRPYSLSSISNKTNRSQDAAPFFAKMQLKAMSPEQLVDSIFIATGADKTPRKPEERRKMYEDWLREFTVRFGDDEGNEATFNGTIVQALMLLNGNRINDAVRASQGNTTWTAARMGYKGLDHVFLAALSRPPNAKERQLAKQIMDHAAQASKSLEVAYQDILWALLNSNEFFLNH
ncbi:MAG: DUF1549 and DUF1553 domain-containing protein [Gemmatales bacterium]|nr:DUF1549 and DUF1553 domain-containing protein [Gemmatales bacterium]MDW8222418.1 DUF1553 domain-containing protein [Gemmatales bacterium]